MPIEIGDSTATVRSKINAVLTDAGLNPADNVDTTAATNLLNQVAATWSVPVTFYDRQPEAEFREAFATLQASKPMPFDSLPPAYASFSTSLLHRSHGGPLVRLRRSSDNAEQDFSSVNGRLDALAVATWRGVGEAFVVTWYDQTGASRNAAQATAARQAKLSADCRTVIFDGTDDTYSVQGSNDYGRAISGLTGALYGTMLDRTTSRAAFQINTPASSLRFRALRTITSGTFSVQSRRLDADSATTLQASSDMGEVARRLIARRDYAGATQTISVDGVVQSAAAGTPGITSDTTSPSPLAFGSNGNSSDYMRGEAICFAFWRMAISDADLAALDAGMGRLSTDFGSDFNLSDFV